MTSEHVIFLSQPLGEMDGLFKAELIREGEWRYPGLPDGRFKITPSDIRELHENFQVGTKGYILPVNEEHNKKTNGLGYIRKTEPGLNHEGKHALFAWFDLGDEKANKDVKDKKTRFVSAEINLAWADPEDGGKTKKVLEGMALTKTPYVKRMAPIEAVNESVMAVNLSEAAASEGVGLEDGIELGEIVRELVPEDVELREPGESWKPSADESGNVRLLHYSGQKNLDALDPETRGTSGLLGADSNQGGKFSWAYLPGAPTERAIRSREHFYASDSIPLSKLYDIHQDHEGIADSARNTGKHSGELMEEIASAAKAKGYLGIYNTHPNNPQPGSVEVFDKVPVKEYARPSPYYSDARLPEGEPLAKLDWKGVPIMASEEDAGGVIMLSGMETEPADPLEAAMAHHADRSLSARSGSFWLAPSGAAYGVPDEGHGDTAAKALLEAGHSGLKSYSQMFKNGWVRRGGPMGPYAKAGGVEIKSRLTPAQIETLKATSPKDLFHVYPPDAADKMVDGQHVNGFDAMLRAHDAIYEGAPEVHQTAFQALRASLAEDTLEGTMKMFTKPGDTSGSYWLSPSGNAYGVPFMDHKTSAHQAVGSGFSDPVSEMMNRGWVRRGSTGPGMRGGVEINSPVTDAQRSFLKTNAPSDRYDIKGQGWNAGHDAGMRAHDAAFGNGPQVKQSLFQKFRLGLSEVELMGQGVEGVHAPEPMDDFSVDPKRVFLDIDAMLDEDGDEEHVHDSLIRAAVRAGLDMKAGIASQGKTHGDTLSGLEKSMHEKYPWSKGFARGSILRRAGYQASKKNQEVTLADFDALFVPEGDADIKMAEDMGLTPATGQYDESAHPRGHGGKWVRKGTSQQISDVAGNFAFARNGLTGFVSEAHPVAVDPDASTLSVYDGLLTPDDRKRLADRGAIRNGGMWSVPQEELDRNGPARAAQSVNKGSVEKMVDAVSHALFRSQLSQGDQTLQSLGFSGDVNEPLALLKSRDPKIEKFEGALAKPEVVPILKRFLDFGDFGRGLYRVRDVLRAYNQGLLKDAVPLEAPTEPAMDGVPGALSSLPWSQDYSEVTPGDVTAMVSAATGALKTNGKLLDTDAAQDARRRLLTLANGRPDLIHAAGFTKASIIDTVLRGAGPDANQPSDWGAQDERKINSGVPPQYHWKGISNLTALGMTRWDRADAAQFFGSVDGDADPADWGEGTGSLRNAVGIAVMAFDSNIGYRHLKLKVGHTSDDGVGGQALATYDPVEDTITTLPDYVNAPAMAHELSHAIDHAWASEFTPDVHEGPKTLDYRGLSSMGDALRMGNIKAGVEPQRIEWAKAFAQFTEGLQDRADASSDYATDPGEVFARFGDWFVRWAASASGHQMNPATGHKDGFDNDDAIRFARLLQWKSYVDAAFTPQGAQGVLPLE